MALEGFDDIEIDGEHRGRGRPPAEIDLGAVERAASIGCSKEEISAILGIVKQTLYNHMEKNPAILEAIERGQEKGRATLRRLQWEGAKEHNQTMLISLGKQFLGQRDTQNVQNLGADGKPIDPPAFAFIRGVGEKPE